MRPTGATLAAGIELFQRQRWFEAHEVLEEVWRPTPSGARREFLQGLIQLAVSLEHWRRGNPRGARGQWTKAQGHLAGLPPCYEGLRVGELLSDFEHFYLAVGLDAAVLAQAEGRRWTPPEAPVPTPRWVESDPG